MNNFFEVYLYTNQYLLKQYLINNEISNFNYENGGYFSSFDGENDGILVFNHEISIKSIKNNFCNDHYNTDVVIKVMLNKKTIVTAYDENGNCNEGSIEEFQDAIAYIVKEPISFCNVLSIQTIDKELVFLQSDTTLFIPHNLINRKFYFPIKSLNDETLENVLSKINTNFKKNTFDNFTYDPDDYDEEEFTILKKDDCQSLNLTLQNKRNKLLAGLIMLVQGDKPIGNKLTPNSFIILNENEKFEKFVSDNIYKEMPFDVSLYLEKPNRTLELFYRDFKNVATNNINYKGVFASAISALLDLKLCEKEEFEKNFINNLETIELKQSAREIFKEERIRDTIKKLKANNDDFLPVYVLYSFFDYDFDRLNNNLIEFGLSGTIYTQLTMALWAMKKGMKSVFEEYKMPKVMYACEKKLANWFGYEEKIIPLREYYSINKIESKDDCYVVGNYMFNYINEKIEYKYCIGNNDEMIEKEICKLKKLLKNSLPFQYKTLKKALLEYEKKSSEDDISVYFDIIHKQYKQLMKNDEKTKRKIKKSEKTLNLFNYQEGDKNNE